MAKQSGLGDNLYVGGFDVSGDVGSLQRIGGGQAVLDVTAINKSAYERLGGIRDGSIEFTGFFNDSTGQLHTTLKDLPTADVDVMYMRGTAIGSPAAVVRGKQITYDPTRGTDGSLTVTTQAQANGFGLEWGLQLTAGKSTISGAGNLASIDRAAATSFGGQAYLQVLGFTGTSATVAVQDSADNSSFSNVTGLVFTAATGVTTERLQLGPTATIRRYVRVNVSGTFSNLVYAVMLNANESATVF